MYGLSVLTRRGVQAFFDATGQRWTQGALAGKYVSVFVSTGTPGGGQETTVINLLSTFVHHGLIFVPLGYSKTFGQLANLSEVRGGEYSFHLYLPQPLPTCPVLAHVP